MIIITILIALLVFLIVILVHEFGHFAVAKLVGIKVNEFAVGMGPKLFQKQKGETLYTVRILPVGGYCAMEGEDEESNDPRSFVNAKWYNKIFVLIAGASMNFFLALILLIGVGFFVGQPNTTIKDFTDSSTAKLSGLEIGDKIIKVNSVNIKKWEDISDEISKADDKFTVTVDRDGEIISYNVEKKDNKIGIYPENDKTLGSAISYGLSSFAMVFNEMIKFLKMVFTGGISLKDVSGPVGIVSTIGDAAKIGFGYLIMLAAFININVGFFNLLPIPALDGSKVLVTILERIRGKKFNQNLLGYINLAGFAFLMLLIIVVTLKDIGIIK